MDYKEGTEARRLEGKALSYLVGILLFVSLASVANADSSLNAAKGDSAGIDSTPSIGASGNSDDSWRLNGENDPKTQAKIRMNGNREEFRNIRVVDSVGWLKTIAFKRPDESLEQLQRQRQQRKTSNLIGFCSERRFQKTGEVDSLAEMTDEERAFCKARLKLANPTLP